MGRNASECRAGLESEDADAEPPMKWRRPMRIGRETEGPHPAAGVMAAARAEGSLRNVRGPAACPQGQTTTPRRRGGRESDRPIVPKGKAQAFPVKRVMTAEGRGLTFGVLVWETMVAGDWR